MLDPNLVDQFRVKPDKKVRLKDYDPGWAQTDRLKELGKEAVRERAEELLQQNLCELAEAQQLLYADDRYALLLIFQGMDAAGKDGIIRHVMTGVNPQGVQVYNFKSPSSEELDHNFLWRCARCLPERGRIGIFNRSWYEEVLIVKVHPELLEAERLPPGKHKKSFWKARYEDIANFEQHLVRNGVIVLKFFLHISKQEQKERFLERLDRPEKHWKFSPADVAERRYWDDYIDAYEHALSATSTEWAPWYIVPADSKWAARAVVSDIITRAVADLNLEYPELTPKQREQLIAARQQLENE